MCYNDVGDSMIAGISFDYSKILKHAKKVSKNISLSSSNISYLKKSPCVAFGTGFIIAVFVWICTLVGILSGNFSIVESIITAFLVFVLVSFFSYQSLSKKMDVKSYQKLKKILKKDYQVYEYQARIEGFYDSIGVSTETNMEFSKRKSKSKSYIMLIEGQKMYVNSKVYEEIKKDKKINIYFAKAGTTTLFYDYSRIEK